SMKVFKVDRTEKVGNNIWYRGKVNGQEMWVHEHFVSSFAGEKTSKLGQIYDSNVVIYKNISDKSSAIKAGKKYTNQVFFIKKRRIVNGDLYDLISVKRSDTKGVVGWVKEQDIKTYRHSSNSNKNKTFYLTGEGNSFSKIW